MGTAACGILREAGGGSATPSDALPWVCACLCAVYANFRHLSQSVVLLTVPGSPIHADLRVRWTRVQICSVWSSANGLGPLSLSFLSFAWDDTSPLAGFREG